MMKAWQHFKTITTHKMWVMRYCFKIGLYWLLTGKQEKRQNDESMAAL